MANENPVHDLTQDPEFGRGVGQDQSVGGFAFHPSTIAGKISACVSASYNNGEICVNFPIVGNICFKVSLPIPNGSTVKVCMETCGFRIGVPPFNGIKASVYFNNSVLWTGVIWGSC